MVDTESILKMRAEQLSQERNSFATPALSLEVLEFNLAGERYAFESRYIKEVYLVKDCTILPTAPQFILGLINVRRKIMSLVDLCYFFDLPKTKDVIGKKAIILEKNDMEFGVLTDSLVHISSIPLNDIQASLPTLNKVRQEFLKGITTAGLIVLDALKLLEYRPLIVDEEL